MNRGKYIGLLTVMFLGVFVVSYFFIVAFSSEQICHAFSEARLAKTFNAIAFGYPVVYSCSCFLLLPPKFVSR